MSNKYRTLASNTLLMTAGTFSSKVLVFLMVRFYTGCLTPEEYGGGQSGHGVDTHSKRMALAVYQASAQSVAGAPHAALLYTPYPGGHIMVDHGCFRPIYGRLFSRKRIKRHLCGVL